MTKNKMSIIKNRKGFTLVEMVIVILVLGILSAVSISRMTESIETSKYEQTKKELDNLAAAIVGNPDAYSGNARSDFGYLGDNGTLPATLNDLVTNSSGWSTWDGPYIERGINSDDFNKDAWNVSYTYTGIAITSTGSGSPITKALTTDPTKLLSNQISGTIRDATGDSPGLAYIDSISISIDYPDGSGSIISAATYPSPDGYFSLTGLPIGNRQLTIIFLPVADTMQIPLTIMPGKENRLDIHFPADLF